MLQFGARDDPSIAPKHDNPVDWGMMKWGGEAALIIGDEVKAILLRENRNLKR